MRIRLKFSFTEPQNEPKISSPEKKRKKQKTNKLNKNEENFFETTVPTTKCRNENNAHRIMLWNFAITTTTKKANLRVTKQHQQQNVVKSIFSSIYVCGKMAYYWVAQMKWYFSSVVQHQNAIQHIIWGFYFSLFIFWVISNIQYFLSNFSLFEYVDNKIICSIKLLSYYIIIHYIGLNNTLFHFNRKQDELRFKERALWLFYNFSSITRKKEFFFS